MRVVMTDKINEASECEAKRDGGWVKFRLRDFVNRGFVGWGLGF